jgi:hypothetical protein
MATSQSRFAQGLSSQQQGRSMTLLQKPLHVLGHSVAENESRDRLFGGPRLLSKDDGAIPDGSRHPDLEEERLQGPTHSNAPHRSGHSIVPHSNRRVGGHSRGINVIQAVFNEANLLELLLDVWLVRCRVARKAVVEPAAKSTYVDAWKAVVSAGLEMATIASFALYIETGPDSGNLTVTTNVTALSDGQPVERFRLEDSMADLAIGSNPIGDNAAARVHTNESTTGRSGSGGTFAFNSSFLPGRKAGTSKVPSSPGAGTAVSPDGGGVDGARGPPRRTPRAKQ